MKTTLTYLDRLWTATKGKDVHRYKDKNEALRWCLKSDHPELSKIAEQAIADSTVSGTPTKATVTRILKAAALVAKGRVTVERSTCGQERVKIKSLSSGQSYIVQRHNMDWSCNCRDFLTRNNYSPVYGKVCKHIHAALFALLSSPRNVPVSFHEPLDESGISYLAAKEGWRPAEYEFDGTDYKHEFRM
jgi:hypothetical protein